MRDRHHDDRAEDQTIENGHEAVSQPGGQRSGYQAGAFGDDLTDRLGAIVQTPLETPHVQVLEAKYQRRKRQDRQAPREFRRPIEQGYGPREHHQSEGYGCPAPDIHQLYELLDFRLIALSILDQKP